MSLIINLGNVGLLVACDTEENHATAKVMKNVVANQLQSFH
ncbi:hypothetical protein NBRC111894_4717 [Sporolactobacillus inulinus]|uniref:Uncharacterized protein n=1 Tax=Sporolactobacillus inulinus TaxID=2078 RepID=A0A4Y1ZJS9_9BACL|nr:hypothetical protein NBRC111894_4717 [Sporolactobacillus inulinus]